MPRTLHLLSLLLLFIAADSAGTWHRRQTSGSIADSGREARVNVYDHSYDVNLRDQSPTLSQRQKHEERQEELELRYRCAYTVSASPLAADPVRTIVVSDDIVVVVCSTRAHRYFQNGYATRVKPFSPKFHPGDRLAHPWLFLTDRNHRDPGDSWDVFLPFNIQQ